MLELILKYFSTPTSPTIKTKEAVKSAALFLLRVSLTAFHFIGTIIVFVCYHPLIGQWTLVTLEGSFHSKFILQK